MHGCEGGRLDKVLAAASVDGGGGLLLLLLLLLISLNCSTGSCLALITVKMVVLLAVAALYQPETPHLLPRCIP
jgi:hypothetical protein